MFDACGKLDNGISDSITLRSISIAQLNFTYSYHFFKYSLKTEQGRNEAQILLSYFTKSSSSPRSISIAQLNTLLHLHLRPINLVVYERP